MSQRNSEYERKENELYETPEWVTELLIPHLPVGVRRVWEPASGNGKMVNVLKNHFPVHATDIKFPKDGIPDDWNQWSEIDFLGAENICKANAIITNPPFNQATEFIEYALELMKPMNGYVAMLQNVDFDSAKSRRHLFRNCPEFMTKIVLTKRIVWFVEANGKPKASPSSNHAWYIWCHDWKQSGSPTIVYEP